METARHWIGGQWLDGVGEAFHSVDPSKAAPVAVARGATDAEVRQAVESARRALEGWAARPVEDRQRVLEAFAAQLTQHQQTLALAISRETGKVLWETREELAAMIGKIALTIAAMRERRWDSSQDLSGLRGVTRYRPHGVLAVFGPFNFPGHLPNGHIAPALLAGNTVVFKPSEFAPWTAHLTCELWQRAGLPQGVLNLIQGGRDTGVALSRMPDIDGILFTGSYSAGRALHQALSDQPEKILALEMGGNNPLVIWQAKDHTAAAYMAIQSSFVTSGQRCSCARRVFIPAGAEGDALLSRILAMTQGLRVGVYDDDPQPFMGPVIHDRSAEKLLKDQETLRKLGGRPLLEMSRLDRSSAMLSPGIFDMTGIVNPSDEECFGPLMQVYRVSDFDEAIALANQTRYGLSAALLSDDGKCWEVFHRRIRAGVVNFNRPTTGASSRLPFGGVNRSGNHRPSAYFAIDYCNYPVASLESDSLSLPQALSPGITL